MPRPSGRSHGFAMEAHGLCSENIMTAVHYEADPLLVHIDPGVVGLVADGGEVIPTFSLMLIYDVVEAKHDSHLLSKTLARKWIITSEFPVHKTMKHNALFYLMKPNIECYDTITNRGSCQTLIQH